MPTPEICKSYNLSSKEYDDCINYKGHYSTPAYKHGGRTCVRHRMPNGMIVEGPTSGMGQTCIEWEDNSSKKGGNVSNNSMGGYLIGPSHEQGGIPAIVDGTEPIEVEGGEFIINKQTVDAVGEDFLHKLNSTETTYHTGGYGSGQLPSPSNYARGGMPNKQRRQPVVANRKRSTPPHRKVQKFEKQNQYRTGGDSNCPPGQTFQNGMCTANAKPSTPRSEPMLRPNAGYKKGGGTKRIKKSIKNKRILEAGGSVSTAKSNTRVSSFGNKHSHSVKLDPLTGNGVATGHGHTHTIVNHIMKTFCDGDGKCHGHSL